MTSTIALPRPSTSNRQEGITTPRRAEVAGQNGSSIRFGKRQSQSKCATRGSLAFVGTRRPTARRSCAQLLYRLQRLFYTGNIFEEEFATDYVNRAGFVAL